ncbi:MAG: hypothetical protein WCJ69_10175 [Betaproteobacteria bacterium]
MTSGPGPGAGREEAAAGDGIRGGALRLRVVDSITELGQTDAGSVAVSGSHGGVSSARYAIAARPLLSVFNDAGVGKDSAGIAALDLLQAAGLAACTVGHQSARIGFAASTLNDGLVTHVNALASALGVIVGVGLLEQDIVQRAVRGT